MWGWVKKTAKKVWSGVKKVGRAVRSGIRVLAGFGSVLINFSKSILSGISIIWEYPLALIGWLPAKKLRLRVWVLSNATGPVADRQRVDALVEVARRVLKKRVNVKLVPAHGDIVWESPEPAPDYVLNPPCSAFEKHASGIFEKRGAWFRMRLARSPAGTLVGYGTPLTFFIVEDVQGEAGCTYAAWFENYGYVDVSGLPTSKELQGHFDYDGVEHTVLAHEMGHGCNLIAHRKTKRNLMHAHGRTGTSLTRWQKAVVRSSTHVTYL